MQGHFEIGNSSYPIGYLEAGSKGDNGVQLYRITHMPTLEALNPLPIGKADAARIASEVNHAYRTNAYRTISQIQQAVAEKVIALTVKQEG